MAEKQKRSLEQWIQWIRDQEMPIFGHTVQSIVSVAEDDEAPAAQLASVVLKDASMTTRVLKLANSIYFNPQRMPMSTISRAVIVLGFNTVRNMCLSISLVDALVRGKSHDRLTHALARAIHAAMQARTIAQERDDESPEEVFIATLLLQIGNMAFWCFSEEEGDRLDELLDQPGYTYEQAEKEVLGFRLADLSAGLAEEWHLNELLLDTLKHPERDDVRTRNIVLAHQVAESAATNGWGSPETQEIIQSISKLTGKSDKNTADMLHNNAHDASDIATFYGAGSAARAIPLPGSEKDRELEEPAEIIEYPEPDSAMQLKILREISGLMEDGGDLNVIMEMTLEGIYHGIGMDRVLFAMLTPDRKGLRAKFALGHDGEKLKNSFHFTHVPHQRNIFFELTEKECCLVVDLEQNPKLDTLLNRSITEVIGQEPFLTATIAVNGRSIGVLFADRALSKRKLDEDSVESFKHFAKQANIGLSLLANRR